MSKIQNDIESKLINFYDGKFTNENHQYWFEDSGFSNFGYWARGMKSPFEASKLLVDKIIEPIADKMKRTNILDVACGAGGTSKQLTNYFAPANITGINISQYQIDSAKKLVPDATFKVMSAVDLDFPDLRHAGG